MKAFVVVAHPEPKSFNGAIFRAAVETLCAYGHQVRESDLHAMGFNPVSDRRNFTSVHDAAYFKQQLEEKHASQSGGFAPDIEQELDKLFWSDLMIWIFPLWWFSIPAILKGWVDRVFVMGRVYGGGKIYETGVMRGKRALISVTTGGPEESYRKRGQNGDIAAILRPIHRGMLRFVGFDVLAPHIVYGPVRQSDEVRQQALSAWSERLRSIESESPIDVGIY